MFLQGKIRVWARKDLCFRSQVVCEILDTSAGTGKLCILGHLGLVFIWSCFVSCLLFLLFYVSLRNLCSGTCRKIRNIFCLNSASLKSILIAKIISPVIFDTDHSFKRLNTLFLTKNLFIEVFMMCRSRLVIFLLQGKVLCFARVIKSLARCLSVGSVRSTLSKKFYLWFFLTQIVHSKR